MRQKIVNRQFFRIPEFQLPLAAEPRDHPVHHDLILESRPTLGDHFVFIFELEVAAHQAYIPSEQQFPLCRFARLIASCMRGISRDRVARRSYKLEVISDCFCNYISLGIEVPIKCSMRNTCRRSYIIDGDRVKALLTKKPSCRKFDLKLSSNRFLFAFRCDHKSF